MAPDRLRDNQAIPRTADGRPPIGPFLNPLIRGSVDLEALGPTPQDAILVGHVADPRAAFCPADRRTECEAAFIVDRVLAAESAAPANGPMPWLTSIQPPRPAADVWAYLATQGISAERPLSIGLVDAPDLVAREPAVADVTGPAGGPVWIVEVLWGGGGDPGHRTTVIVADGAIELGRRNLAIIIDGAVQPGVMTSE